ncbi:MAG: hypothetical protein H7138_12605 [Myxococcales bacterium]|nr:hypothetical protein [Myxococcales bacterium]
MALDPFPVRRRQPPSAERSDRIVCAHNLESGALVPVLEKFSPASESFYLYYPARTMMSGKLRAFLELMRATNWAVPR